MDAQAGLRLCCSQTLEDRFCHDETHYYLSSKVNCYIVPAAGDSVVGVCNKVGILTKDRLKKEKKLNTQ